MEMSAETLNSIFIVIQGISSLILAVLTFFYLREVAKTREITSKALELEWTTDIDTDLTASHYIIDRASNKIIIPCQLTISSIARLPVDLLEGGSLVIKIDNDTINHPIRPLQKLGSSTNKSFSFNISRAESEINRLEKLDVNSVMQWDSALPGIEAKINLKYKDGLTGQPREKDFEYKYEFNEWKIKNI